MRPSGFLALTLILIGLGLFSLFAPIVQEARTTPAVTIYQTETPYTTTSTSETTSTTATTKTVDGYEDAVGDGIYTDADITSIRFEKQGDFLKTTLTVFGRVTPTAFGYGIAIDTDKDDYSDFNVILTSEGCSLYTGKNKKIMDLRYEVDEGRWVSYIPLTAIRDATNFYSWAITATQIMPREEVRVLDLVPDTDPYHAEIIVYSESTRTVTLYPKTTITQTSIYTTSSTYNSTYTVNVPIKQRTVISPILFAAAVALTLAPLALAKPKAEIKPSEEAKFCFMCGAKLKTDAKFCDECGEKQE